MDAYYELSDGDPLNFIEPETIERRTGLSAREVDAARRYLTHEGLVEERAIGGLSSITHDGVLEVERARSQPGVSTDHFLPVVIKQVFHGAVGAVQTGSGSHANVQQTVGVDAAKLVDLIMAMQQAIPQHRTQLREAVEDLAEEVSKPQAKLSKVRAYLAAVVTYGKDIVALAGLAKDVAKLFGMDLP